MQIGNQFNRIRITTTVLVIVLAIVTPVETFFLRHEGAHAALEYDNAIIADIMLRYKGSNGVEVCKAAGRSTAYAGQCKQTVNCALSIASGGRQYPTDGNTHHEQFKNGGGVEVSPSNATKGDIIQVETSKPHTAVVIENLGNNNFNVVDSNYKLDGVVREHEWQVPAGARVWRMGTPSDTGNRDNLKSRATNTLVSSQTLNQEEFIVSPNGRYILVMQGDGNLVMYSKGRALWSSGTNRNNGAYLGIQGDGNMVIYKSDRRTPIWSTGTVGDASKLVVQDDGNIVAYNNKGNARWASNTVLSVPDLKYVGSDSLTTGVWMTAGQYIRSNDWRYIVVMQGDGNLVAYAAGDRVIWSSGTDGNHGSKLVIQGDNNAVIYRPDGSAVWASNTVSSGLNRLTIQGDGNFVGYTKNSVPKWASNTNGRF
jgi:hypothetical protein